MSKGINLLIRNMTRGGHNYFRYFIASFHISSSLQWHINPRVICHIVCFLIFLAILSGLARNLVLEPTSSLLGIYFVSISHIPFIYVFSSSYTIIDSTVTALRHSIQLQQLMC